MIKVYFETNGYAELTAIFKDEETYMANLKALEAHAEATGFVRVTEVLRATDIDKLDRLTEEEHSVCTRCDQWEHDTKLEWDEQGTPSHKTCEEA